MRRNPFLWLLVVTLVATWLACPVAEARGKPRPGGKSAVAQLKPQEVEALRKKIPNWDQLDRGKQERIARGIVKLRGLNAEQRRKLEQRLKDLGEGGKRDRRFRAEWMRYAQSIGESVWRQLPASVHEEIAKRRIRPATVKMVLSHKVRSKIAAAEGRAFTRADVQALPPNMRKRAEGLLAVVSDEAADEKERQKARSGLGHVQAHARIEALRKELAAGAADGRVPVEQFAAALRRTWPAAFDGVAQEVAENPGRLGDMIQRRSQRGGAGMPGMRDAHRAGKPLSSMELAGVVMQLERAARQNWKKRPDLQASADRVIRRILVGDLKVDAAAVSELPSFDRPKEREKALRGLVQRSFKRDGRRKPR